MLIFVKVSIAFCYISDKTPPRLHGNGCPSNIVVATDINNDHGAHVTWKPPVASDNSGKLMTSIDPNDIKGNSHVFSIGHHMILYNFTDPVGLTVSCHFMVTVFGKY